MPVNTPSVLSSSTTSSSTVSPIAVLPTPTTSEPIALLSSADRESLLVAIATIRQTLPFLQALTVAERRTMLQMGDKSRVFVQRALEVAVQNPDILPRAFSIEMMQQDLKLFESLYPVLMALTQLHGLVEDTCMAAGGRAYTAARKVYRHAKASEQEAGLKPLVAEMGQLYKKSRRTKAENPSEAAMPES